MNEQRECCPCCGFNTVTERCSYEICNICWWEDDGQDDGDADLVRGGPNSDLSLTEARRNFIRFGISNPRRKDLKPGNRSKFRQVRRFALTDDDAVIEAVD